MTTAQEIELLKLLEQEHLEAVTPKMEAFRKPYRIKLAHGGRAAGAKSWSCVSLIVQRAHREPIRVGFFREIQQTLAESAYELTIQTINRLGYSGWHVTKDYIDSPVGGHFIFRGLKDIRASNQVKSLEGFDIFFIEEAATISHESISMLLPTLRKEGSELWAIWNPETDSDPIFTDLWKTDREDVLRVDLKPGKEDNPFFPDILKKEMETAYKNNPDEAEHVWGGMPRKQGDNAVMSRVAIRAACERIVEESEPDEMGVDVARFGDDSTQMYRRKGFKTIAHKEFKKRDTQFVADAAWDMAGRERTVVIKVDDTGVGGGVTDALRRLGATVVAVNFGSTPHDKNKYDSVASEMWFDFPIDDVQLPNDGELREQLGGRLYNYDKRGRRVVESKAEYKKRFGNSPDKADAILLAYYRGKSSTGTSDGYISFDGVY